MSTPPGWPGWPEDDEGNIALPKPTKPKKPKPRPKRKPRPHTNPNGLPPKAIDLVEFNRAAEDRFVRYVDDLIGTAGGSVPAATVIQETAYLLNVSIETTKRYLVKYTASQAPFQIVEKGLVSRR